MLIKQLIALFLSLFMTLGLYTPASMKIENVPEKSEGALRIVSFNVRCKDDLYGSVKGRSQLIVSALRQYRPDSFGVQEATQQWLDIFEKELGDEYGCVAQLRDGAKDSEASAVYYLKEKFVLLDSGTMWLSETPDVFASKLEMSGCTRIATWATLKEKTSGKVYTHINTHLDHILEAVRVEQVKILETKIEELKAQGNPVICTGDFNTYEGDEAYNEMITCLDDSKYLAAESDEGKTFHNYGKMFFKKMPIDFVFVSDGVTVNRYKIIDEKIGMMYLSDHYGVCVDVVL
ncbi:MAG: endonuclease/exonuclease/phosphatase family protein [Clostridia bacterium]|nr:endonuclease/exonuclease/phosphatase family protein [Clostridia bacterium]